MRAGGQARMSGWYYFASRVTRFVLIECILRIMQSIQSGKYRSFYNARSQSRLLFNQTNIATNNTIVNDLPVDRSQPGFQYPAGDESYTEFHSAPEYPETAPPRPGESPGR
jgi:hypothetical protein